MKNHVVVSAGAIEAFVKLTADGIFTDCCFYAGLSHASPQCGFNVSIAHAASLQNQGASIAMQFLQWSLKARALPVEIHRKFWWWRHLRQVLRHHVLLLVCGMFRADYFRHPAASCVLPAYAAVPQGEVASVAQEEWPGQPVEWHICPDRIWFWHLLPETIAHLP